MARWRTWVLVGLMAWASGSEARADGPSWLSSPVVREAARRAVLRAGLDDGVVRSLANRARTAAWLPSVSLHVARGLGANSTVVTNASDRLALAESLSFDVRLSFDLDRLLFDGHEVAVQRLAAQRATQRMALERSVVELLARLEALRLRAEVAEPDVEARVQRARYEAELELRTGVAPESLLALGRPERPAATGPTARE